MKTDKKTRVSFTGAQSSGKTTLLNASKEMLKDKGWKFVDEVTRYVAREYDVPINEAGTDITQLLILAQHLENVYSKHEKILMDRCIIDGLVYTKWLESKGKVRSSTLEHAYHIFKATITKMDLIFYTSPVEVGIHDDGVRSINTEFRNEIAQLFEQTIDELEEYSNIEVVRLKGSPEQRMEVVANTLKNKGLI